MKLTKGKVPKLLGKKKQSLKRYKKGKKQGNKRRTFRKRGSSIDLSKKTLKNARFRMKGGVGEDEFQEQIDGEEQEQLGNNIGTMEQSLASLKEMTVGDLVSYLAQEIANKTLQTTLGPQTTEEALPAAALIQSKAGEEEQEEKENAYGLTPEKQATLLAQQGQAAELTPEEQEALLAQQGQAAKVEQEQQTVNIGEDTGELTPEEQTAKDEEAARLIQTVNIGEKEYTVQGKEESGLVTPVVVDEKNEEIVGQPLEPGVKSLEEQPSATPTVAPIVEKKP